MEVTQWVRERVPIIWIEPSFGGYYFIRADIPCYWLGGDTATGMFHKISHNLSLMQWVPDACYKYVRAISDKGIMSDDIVDTECLYDNLRKGA